MQPQIFLKGKYTARLTRAPADIEAAGRLRYRAFIDPNGHAIDHDQFDQICDHVLIENTSNGELVACFRLMMLANGTEIGASYAAQFYDLSALRDYPGAMVEMGRFCTQPGLQDADVLRVAWAMMTRIVDAHGFKLMFGCSSFEGTDPTPFHDAFAMLKHRHLAPEIWQPRVKAAKVYRYCEAVTDAPNKKHANQVMPPLLRTYLLMGGWVSDHAVIDHDLGTLHVFTGLEVASVPPARARILRKSAE